MATGTLDSGNVRVAVTGAWYAGPTTATAPSAADSELPSSFVNLGYLSEDGTTRTTDRSTNDIKAWQKGALLRRTVTDSGLSYQFTLVETKKETLELYFGAAFDEDGSIDIDPGETGGRKSFVFDVIDGDEVLRVYIAEGEVTEVGDITYDSGDPVGYEVTVTAYASAALDGAAERRFYPSLATTP